MSSNPIFSLSPCGPITFLGLSLIRYYLGYLIENFNLPHLNHFICCLEAPALRQRNVNKHSKTSFEKNCFSAWASTLNMGLINKVDMVCLSPVGYGV